MSILTQARPARAAAASLLAVTLCLSLPGCQSPMGPGASLAVDTSDPCTNERSAFAGSKTYFQDKLATGALTGAAIGAASGIAFGLIHGRVDAGTVVAATVIGGVAGAGTAYYNTLAERARDQEELASAMNQDLARETQEIDRTTATFARLRACRFGQAQFVKNQVRSRALDRPTGLARIAFHRDRFDQEIRIAREFGLSMARRGEQFQQAANDLRTRPPAARPGVVATRASPARVASVNRAASVSVPEKRASFDRTVASAESSGKTAFNLDSNTSLSWLSVAGFDA
ncbi:MAG: hypothetical protein EXR07_05515 [Acetobacteraceae bacterium]|nr:hypothetical protein [Acetobacteraceae bacterium]